MNKKANLQQSIYFLLFLTILVFLWIYMINPVISDRIPTMITANNITGIQAFFWYNLNLFFFITILFIVIGYTAYFRKSRIIGP